MSDSTTPATDPVQLEQHGKPNVRILYEETSAVFANQVIVNSGRDQIILDFSTGIISDQSSNNHVLPIQSRIAMTPSSAANLVNTLAGVLRQISKGAGGSESAEPAATE
tara:strand:+ start:13031 stop:13357 length:327 start_codon:yes stop_codon:yes gene_type:complete